MLSPDRSEPRVRASRRAGTKAAARAARRGAGKGAKLDPAVEAQQAQGLTPSFDPSEPWDAASAEALMRLYESDEGNLGRPPARERSSDTGASGAPRKGAPRRPEADGVDRTWLEAHLSRLAKRLQRSLAQAAPDRSLAARSLAALSDRLDTIEQRFGAALGRVAQRADLDGLKSIETEVMELAAQLVEARDRLDRIGAVDEEVRAVAQRLDEAGERRAAALEKLLRDCLAEWRAGEERTASALHSLEEGIGRLGDSVDAMEASKPAPDLTVPGMTTPGMTTSLAAPGLTSPGLGMPGLDRSPTAAGPLSQPHAATELMPTARFYHSTLDAADYVPKPATPTASPAEAPVSAAPALRLTPLPAAAVAWSQQTDEVDPSGARATLAASSWEIADLRSGPPEAPRAPFHAAHAADAGRPDETRRASLGLLLATGAAILASSTYLIYQAVVAPILPAARPAATEPGPQAVGGEPELPGGRRG